MVESPLVPLPGAGCDLFLIKLLQLQIDQTRAAD